ncbi:MAG: hypothetical protein CL928_06820 [Deltaproteobacteria bacterium]|nr:hypothetical protein [Deltaproteobacteria bacterium]
MQEGDGRSVLEGIDVAIHPGEMVAISGPSGVGKSVLGSLMLRLRSVPPPGRVFWGEQEVTNLSARELQPLRVRYQGLLQQTGAILPPFLTVRQALTETVCQVCVPGAGVAEARDRVEHVADLLGIQKILDRYPRFLSGGEQRKSGVARLLLADPVFAFVDEPDAGLDPVSQHEVIGELRQAVERTGVAMLLVTHSAVLAEHYADRRILLREGQLHAA